MKSQDKHAIIPYSNLGKVLLDCIFDGLIYFVETNGDLTGEQSLKASDENLRKCFSPFFNHPENIRGVNPHFSQGHTSKNKWEARVVKILLKTCIDVMEETKDTQGFALPSPLFILHQILTVPEEPHSSAYSLIFSRTLLFENFKVFPEHVLLPPKYKSFNISDINNYLDNFYSYTKQSNNIPQTKNVPAQLMLAHFLAMKGVFYLRFGNRESGNNKIKRNKKTTKKDRINSALAYLSAKKLSDDKGKSFEFHKFTFFEELPEAATLVNELAGIPMPIRGAETIFQGGLKTDSNSNLVIRLSGEPGSGKTSFALALSAVMSPLNTFSYYLTLEESPKDLKNRLISLIPTYLKKLSIFNSDTDSWFWSDKVFVGQKNRLDFFESEYIDRISEQLNKRKSEVIQESLPAICPLIIVIDSIRVLLKEENSNLEKFIEKCKKLNAIIILISANDEKFHHEIDYMVDLVIHLNHSGTHTQLEKPTRILQLSKTRHQISRPGSHVFHLSGEKGLRISPQLPSQIDKKEKISKPIPSTDFYINFFNEYKKDTILDNSTPLSIWNTSQVLFHGYGSSGKAGLSLSLLLSPIYSKNINLLSTKSQLNLNRKVLIISLLYPENYYNDLKSRIAKKFQNLYKEHNVRSKVECLYFYSGYLTPEDFISRILQKLDEAILGGEPFTGILLDGLHNVSLQFHKLQESDMVWPTLYSLLAKYKLTIVTTFTNFAIGNEKNRGAIDDDEILLKGHKPLLHALVQATDYHFILQPPSVREGRYEGKYIVTLKSAIRHKLAGEKFVWDRELLSLSQYYQTTQTKIFDLEEYSNTDK